MKDAIGIEPREREENTGLWKMDKPFRLDPPRTPSDFEKVPFLSDEEKALGVEYMKKTLTEPKYEWGLGKGEMPKQERIFFANSLGCLNLDPKLYAIYERYYEDLVSLITGLDGNAEIMQATTKKDGIDATAKRGDPEVRRRLGNVLLICLAVSAERGWDQYFLQMMASTSTQTKPDENGSYCIPTEKALMLRYPKSSVWTDEESLVLEFTYAVMRHEMTDEIWDRAMAAWGPKEPMRYIQWIGNYIWMIMFMNALSRRKDW
ncbi:MAG: hypothetical protein HKP58_10380 [Desulfatitalea sp.]|nr:hypothetical protein [Desulfatitalea sp.]NNK00807.1 hypothetical protein [Desulfatitalea sp.]